MTVAQEAVVDTRPVVPAEEMGVRVAVGSWAHNYVGDVWKRDDIRFFMNLTRNAFQASYYIIDRRVTKIWQTYLDI